MQIEPALWYIADGGANSVVEVTPEELILGDTKNPGDAIEAAFIAQPRSRYEQFSLATHLTKPDTSLFQLFNDLLFLNGDNLRVLPLIERKARLIQLLRRKKSPVLYVDYIEARGRPFFEKVCELDLEGIVAKRKTAAFRPTDRPSPYWVKMKNRNYSQAEGRDERFNPKSDGIIQISTSRKPTQTQ